MAIRFLLLLFLGYILWKIVQIVLRIVANSARKKYVRDAHVQESAKSAQKNYVDIQDAKFEEIKPDKTTKGHSASSE